MKPIPNDALFHCVPLGAAQMRVAMCRANGQKPLTAKRGHGDHRTGELRPAPCRGCALAVELEAGRVETWTLAQAEAALLSGERRPLQ